MEKIISHTPIVPYNAPFSPKKENMYIQESIDGLLQFNPENFLSMMADMEDAVLMEYLDQESPSAIEKKIIQMYYCLIWYWSEKYEDDWSVYGASTRHFLSNFTGRIISFSVKGREGFPGIIRILRFLSALYQHKEILSVFIDSENRLNAGNYGVDAWLEMHEKGFKKYWS